MINSIWARTFDKYIFVAHPDDGNEFFDEVALCFFSIFSVYFVFLFFVDSLEPFFFNVHIVTVTSMNFP